MTTSSTGEWGQVGSRPERERGRRRRGGAPGPPRCPPQTVCPVPRISLTGMKISRPDVRIGRYRMIKHERDKHNEPNPQR